MIGSANDEVPIQLHLNEQTAPAVVDRALSNDFDEEDIGFRRPDASKRSRAVESGYVVCAPLRPMTSSNL